MAYSSQFVFDLKFFICFLVLKMLKNRLAIFIAFALLTIASSAYEIQPRITNGQLSEYGQFPFFTFLAALKPNKTLNFCGGSLIGDQWILTAAHCLRNTEKIVVLMNTVKFREACTNSRFTDIVTKEHFYIHPKYKDEYLQYDIGLIKLTKKLQLNDTIKTIKLPTDCNANENLDAIIVGNGRSAIVKGMGMPPILLWADVRTIPYSECAMQYPSVRFQRILCAISENDGSSIREGDSGGPLVRKSDNTLIGVANFRNKNASKLESPQGFANVIVFHKWIQSITNISLVECSEIEKDE